MSSRAIQNLSKARGVLFLASFLLTGFICYIGLQGILDIQKLSWLGKNNIVTITSALLAVVAVILILNLILEKVQERQLYGQNYSKKSVLFDTLKGLIMPITMIAFSIMAANFASNMNNGLGDLITKLSTIKDIIKIPELVTVLDKVTLIKTTLDPQKLNEILTEVKNALSKISEYSSTLKTTENLKDIEVISKFIDNMKGKLDKMHEANNGIKTILTMVSVAMLAFALYQMFDFVKNFVEAKHKNKDTCEVGKNVQTNYADVPSILLRAFEPTVYSQNK